MSSQLLTYDEAARFLAVAPSTLRKWVMTGKIACTKLGNGPKAPVRFTESQLESVFNVQESLPRR